MDVSERDELAKDLIKLVGARAIEFPEDKDQLIQDLVIYIVERDNKILKHGIKLGKEQK